MDAKCINVFMEAFAKTLGQFGVIDIKRVNIKKKEKLFVDLDVATAIGLKGGIQGNIALSMPQDTARKLASAMMMGMNVASIDDMAKSAIGEMSSMIAGTASTMLQSLEVSVQITPPQVVLNHTVFNSYETLAIEYDSQVGKLEFNIGFV